MRIGLYGRVLLKPGSGIVRYSYDLIENLLKYDKKDKFILYVQKNHLPYREFDSRLEIHEVNLPYFMWRTPLFTRILDKDDLDIYHSSAYTLPLVSKKFRSFSTVSTFHGLHPEIFWQSFKDNIYCSLDYRSAAIFADRIQAVSNTLKEEIHKIYKQPLDKIDVVYFGLSKEFKPISSKNASKEKAIYERYGIRKGKYILCVSGTTKNKNTETILKAWSILKFKHKFKLPLVLLRADLNKKLTLIKSLGLLPGKDVIAIDWVDDMRYLYGLSNFTIYPSIYEGLGFPIIEAMACGAPVITSNASAMPEAAGNAALLVNNPTDPTEWSDAILSLYSNPELKEELVKKGFERAKEFSWDKIIKKVLNSYRKLSSM